MWKRLNRFMRLLHATLNDKGMQTGIRQHCKSLYLQRHCVQKAQHGQDSFMLQGKRCGVCIGLENTRVSSFGNRHEIVDVASSRKKNQLVGYPIYSFLTRRLSFVSRGSVRRLFFVDVSDHLPKRKNGGGST